ncbi:MAG: hypothetical protein JWP91_2765, partial [Fibrobacteres bacterium]|nr:hypothetical protein [Fibrobacterota bacterium]
ANRAGNNGAFALGAIRGGILLAVLVFTARKWLIDDLEPVRFGSVLLLVTCVDLLWVNSSFIQVYNPDRMLPNQPAIEYLKSDTSSFRVFGLPGAYERWVMQYNLIETTDGWTDNEYRLYREFRGDDYMNNPNFMAGLKQNADGSVSGSAFLDMLNVKYLAYRREGEGAIILAPNTSALPRAWFVPAWRTEANASTLEKMKQADFNPRALAYISDSTRLPEGFAASQEPEAPEAAPALIPGDTGKAAQPAPPASAQPQAGITRLAKTYNRHAYKVENARPGILVLSELWFPHWHLKVDGKEAPLLRADFAFRGAALAAGSHEVVLTYDSPWIHKGFMASGLSLIVLAAGLFGIARFAPAAAAPRATAAPRAAERKA